MADVPLMPISADYDTAGRLTGYSADTIRRAVEAGELTPHYPEIGLKRVAKPVLLVDDLRAWIERGPSQR